MDYFIFLKQMILEFKKYHSNIDLCINVVVYNYQVHIQNYSS